VRKEIFAYGTDHHGDHGTPGRSPTPTPTYYQQLAAEVIKAFDAIGVLPKLDELRKPDTKQARKT
jgi:hypothetical protein